MANTGFQLPYQYQPGIQFANQNPQTGPGAYNPWQFPGAPPTYTGSFDPNTMGLSSDPTALNMFTQQAERTGPSAYANLANAQQDAQAGFAKSAAAGSAAGQMATADSNLAMSGGLNSGARERIQTSGARNVMDMNQKINETSANNKMQIGMNDEQNRISQLGSVPGMQNTQNEAAKFNIGNAINEGNAANAYKYGIYNSQMQGWGAGQQAQATSNSGGGGSSFICTALREAGLMSNRETVIMTRFMLGGILSRADFFAWYFKHGEKGIALAKQQNFDFSSIKKQMVDDIIEARKNEGEEFAQALYIVRAGKFIQMFTGEKFDMTLVNLNPVRALLSIPVVFSRPATWRWARAYYTPKVKHYFQRRFSHV